MNYLAHWSPVRYASSGDATGYPGVPGDPPLSGRAAAESIPEQRSAGGIFVVMMTAWESLYRAR